MGRDDEILRQINNLRIINLIANLCLINFILIPIVILFKFLIHKKWKIDLTYEMDAINKKNMML